MKALRGFHGLPSSENLTFALSERSQLFLCELMDTLQKQAHDMMERHHFKEVRAILALEERLTALNCPSVAEKAQGLLERLKLQVGEWASQDDKLTLLQRVQVELPILAEDAKKSLMRIRGRLAEKTELKNATTRAEAIAAEERTARATSERLREEENKKHSNQVTVLQKEIRDVNSRVAEERTARATSENLREEENKKHLEQVTELRKEIKQVKDQNDALQQRQREVQAHTPPPQPIHITGGGDMASLIPFMMGGMGMGGGGGMDMGYTTPRRSPGGGGGSIHSTPSICSSGSGRASNPWNEFQHAHAGQGLSPKQMSAAYRHSKR